MQVIQIFYISYILVNNVSFNEPVELTKLMKALNECIMFNINETKNNIKRSRLKALVPSVNIGGRFEENDLETNKLAETSPYLLTNFKSGWSVDINLRWTLDEIIFSKDEINLRKEYQNNIERYITLQKMLSETYYKIIEILKKIEKTTDREEIKALEKEYDTLNAKINILTCHKYKTIQKKEE